ncbi:Secreted protein OS=Streptomyces glaucescens OX=1907 GN=SGLAU_17085 PE=4 SV=1 [Streptomyces glaucescens]
MRWCRSSAVRARVAVTGVVMGALTALTPASASADTHRSTYADTYSDADARAYAFAADARPVPGATGTTDAALLEPGGTYRSTLPADGAAYYRLALDTESTAYVSATAVPDPAATVSASDGIKVSVQDTDSRSCSYDSATVGASRSPRPITAWGTREAGKARCEGSGTYYVVVERTGATAGPVSEPWELELTVATEPRTARTGATSAPKGWDSASPAPPGDEPERRPGGSGFDTATAVGQGVWTADVEPGRTLFYEVPVDWGQQLYATAELGSAGGTDGTGHDFAAAALNLSLHNPVRALVEDAGTGYDGRQQSASLDPLPPVDYANRYAPTDRVRGLRFAGSYYLVVHLAARVAEKVGPGPYGLTLRVRVKGDARNGPLYAGRSVPAGLFEVTDGERQASAGGTGGGGGLMTAVAVGGLGAGTAILAGLAVWVVRARRSGAGGL